MVSLDIESSCEPRKKKGKMRVGPTLATGRHGCDSDECWGWFLWSARHRISDDVHSDGYLTLNSVNPPSPTPHAYNTIQWNVIVSPVRGRLDEYLGQAGAPDRKSSYSGARNFHFGDGSSLVGSRSESLARSLWGTKSPRSWSSLQTWFTDLDCRNDQHLKISHNSPPSPDSWPVRFTVGAKQHFGARPANPAATDGRPIKN